MLQTIRDRLTGPIVWVIIALISVPFAIWGIQSFQTGDNDPVVATVGSTSVLGLHFGGVDITQGQFRNEYEQYYRRLQTLQGENFRADSIDPVATRDLVLKEMIARIVLDQYTRKAGYRLDDAALREFLETIPQFQDKGRFSAQRYREMLTQNAMTPESFEAMQRDRLPKEQLREVVLDSAFVSAQEWRQAWQLAHQQRSYSYVALPSAKYVGAVNVSDAQIKQEYEQNQSSYQAPERIKLAYLELDLSEFAPAAAPSAEILKAIYEAQKGSAFSTPEERRASHILISFGADKSASKAKAQALYDKLQQGADFAETARQNSDDPGSKSKGGDLGWIKRGTLTPKFEAALFDLKPGQISEPVETEFGWHLIKLTEFKPAKTAAFEDADVQKQLLEIYRQKDAAQRFTDESQQLEQLSFENPNSLDAAAKALNLTPKTTDWFTRSGGGGITANPAVITAAFSREITQDDENSKPIPIDPTHLVVVRKAEYEAPHTLALAEVSDKIRDELKLQAAKAKAAADADALVAAVAGGQSLEAAAKAQNLAVVTPTPAKRDNKDGDKVLLDALFKMPHPVNDKPSVGKVVLSTGDIAVLALQSVSDDGAAPAPGTPDFKRDSTQLRDAQAGAELQAFVTAMEKEISVKRKAEPIADKAESTP
jgi:peptidyl-prolyl cis-trans isomerase D